MHVVLPRVCNMHVTCMFTQTCMCMPSNMHACYMCNFSNKDMHACYMCNFSNRDVVSGPIRLKYLSVSSVCCFIKKVHWLHFYQPATREACGQLVLRLLCVFHVCICLCVSALITCAIITSRKLLPCDLTWASWLRQFRRLLCVATVSSLVQLRVREGNCEAEAT